MNSVALASRKLRKPNTRVSHAREWDHHDLGHQVAGRDPGAFVPVAPISPWICGKAELVIEISSVAISAPSEPAATASQSAALARSASGAGAAGEKVPWSPQP